MLEFGVWNVERLNSLSTEPVPVPVSGAILATMNDEGLREVGVETGVHRTALLHHITNFTAEGVPPELLVSSPFELWTCELALFLRCPEDSLCPD